jgi:hypothetical protein|nr:MAG: hypothetical protein [Bacteriophage sp.]
MKKANPAKQKKMIIVFVILMVIIMVTAMSNKDDEQAPAKEDQYTPASFEEIYQAYEDNELVADDLYKGRRYEVTATINGMETGGLMNMTGGATLTMEKKIGNTIVVFLAEFERDQEEALKNIKVGDEITFEGTCYSAGSWSDCELVN